MRLHWILARGLLVVTFGLDGISAGSCTLCVDGSQPSSLSGNLSDGTKCSHLNKVALGISSSSSDDCLLLQALGYQTCGCFTPPQLPEDTSCRICQDGANVLNPELEIPGLNTSCGALEVFIILNEESGNFCDMLPQFEHYCGCPNVESPPACTLCPNGFEVSEPQENFSSSNLTCGTLELFASLAPNQTLCEDFRNVFTSADGENICGCFETGPLSVPTTLPLEAPTTNPYSGMSPSMTPTSQHDGTPPPTTPSSHIQSPAPTNKAPRIPPLIPDISNDFESNAPSTMLADTTAPSKSPDVSSADASLSLGNGIGASFYFLLAGFCVSHLF